MAVRITQIILLCAILTTSSQAFTTPRARAWTHPTINDGLHMAKKSGKGFARQQEQQPPPSPPSPETTTTNTPPPPPPPATPLETSTASSRGAEALARLRRAEAEKRDAELRNMRELRQVDREIREEEQNAAIPERVAGRMGRRMLPFVGLPLFGGMGVFVAFWYLATYKGLEFQPTLVAYSTIAVLVVGLLGISYSVMSASWDPETEGSALGIEEFQTNVGNIQSGLRRSRENALLREKMRKIPQDQLQNEMKRLEKDDEKKDKAMGLKEKLEKDLE